MHPVPIVLSSLTTLFHACSLTLMGRIAFGLSPWFVSINIGLNVEQLVNITRNQRVVAEDMFNSWNLMASNKGFDICRTKGRLERVERELHLNTVCEPTKAYRLQQSHRILITILRQCMRLG